jgi:hypothetical protein
MANTFHEVTETPTEDNPPITEPYVLLVYRVTADAYRYGVVDGSHR